MGHAAADVWAYTPKRLAGFLELAYQRQRREWADLMVLQAMASRGEPKKMQKIADQLRDD